MSGDLATLIASEAKTTFPDGAAAGGESDSSIFLTPIDALGGRLVLCRLGNRFYFFRNLDGNGGWTQEIHTADTLYVNGAGLVGPDYAAAFERPDLAETLQVGLIANRYTDGGGSPVRVEVDYFRLARPADLGECTSLFD